MLRCWWLGHQCLLGIFSYAARWINWWLFDRVAESFNLWLGHLTIPEWSHRFDRCKFISLTIYFMYSTLPHQHKNKSSKNCLAGCFFCVGGTHKMKVRWRSGRLKWWSQQQSSKASNWKFTCWESSHVMSNLQAISFKYANLEVCKLNPTGACCRWKSKWLEEKFSLVQLKNKRYGVCPMKLWLVSSHFRWITKLIEITLGSTSRWLNLLVPSVVFSGTWSFITTGNYLNSNSRCRFSQLLWLEREVQLHRTQSPFRLSTNMQQADSLFKKQFLWWAFSASVGVMSGIQRKSQTLM